MERMTWDRVQARCSNVNRRLEMRGSSKRVEVSRRNGHVVLDEMARAPGGSGYGVTGVAGSWIVRDVIQAGTRREIADGLWWMMRGIDLVHDRPTI